MISILENALSRDAFIVGSVLVSLGTIGLVARRSFVHAAFSIGVMTAGVVVALAASGISGGASRDLFAVAALLWLPAPTALLTALVLRRMRRPREQGMQEPASHDDSDVPADVEFGRDISP